MRTVVYEKDNRQVIQEGNKFFARLTEGDESFESQDYGSLERAKRSLGIEPTAEENNKMIAEFMGAKPNKGGEFELCQFLPFIEDYVRSKHFYFTSEMLFHSDWNWLMEVVEKIEDLNYSVEINKQEDGDYQCLVTKSGIISSEFSNIKIEAVYNACTNFIRQYNNQNK